MTSKPSRDAFTAAYLDRLVTINELCLRYRVSDTTVKHWARRFGLPPRPTGGWRGNAPAAPLTLKAYDNHCREVVDVPQWGDPTREEIAELAAYCRARRIMEGAACHVAVEQEEMAWAG
jgi:hypothetical protein